MANIGKLGGEKIITRLKILKLDLYESVALYDSQGAARLALPSLETGNSEEMRRAALQAIASREIVFTDLYRVPKTNKIYLSLAIPIQIGAQKQIVGAVVCQVDPDLFLYPALQSRPLAEETSELVLISKKLDENVIVYLNNLRFLKAPPLTIHKSFSELQLVCVRAALGQKGILRALDYRGAEVVAASRTIPDSPWFLLAKIDTALDSNPLRLVGKGYWRFEHCLDWDRRLKHCPCLAQLGSQLLPAEISFGIRTAVPFATL